MVECAYKSFLPHRLLLQGLHLFANSLCHTIEGVSQPFQFIAALNLCSRRQVSPCKFPAGRFQLSQWFCHTMGDHGSGSGRQQKHHHFQHQMLSDLAVPLCKLRAHIIYVDKPQRSAQPPHLRSQQLILPSCSCGV